VINLFKSSRPYVLGLIPVIALSFWSYSIYVGTLPIVEQAMPLYYAVIILLSDLPVIANIVAVALIVLEALMLNNILEKHQVLSEKTKVPALIYTLLMCSCPPLLVLHPVLFANFFLILLLDRIFLTYRSDVVLTNVYDAGLLIGIATVFFLPSIMFLPFYIISLSILRPFNARECILSFIGFLTPMLFVVVNFYWTGELADFWRSMRISSLDTFTFELDWMILFLPLLLITFIISMIGARSYIEEMNSRVVKVTKMYLVFIWFFVFALLSLMMAPSLSAAYFSVVFIALAVYLANFFVSFRRKKLAEFILFLLIATILYSHIVPL